MSSRPIKNKQLDQLRKELRITNHQAFVDVFRWMKLRGHVTKRKEAVQLVLDGRLRGAEGQTIGILGEAGRRYAAAFIKWQDAQGMYLIDEATNEAEKRVLIEEKKAALNSGDRARVEEVFDKARQRKTA